MLLSVTMATSIMSTPFAFGAVRAASIISCATRSTCSWRLSFSLSIIVQIQKI